MKMESEIIFVSKELIALPSEPILLYISKISSKCKSITTTPKLVEA